MFSEIGQLRVKAPMILNNKLPKEKIRDDVMVLLVQIDKYCASVRLSGDWKLAFWKKEGSPQSILKSVNIKWLGTI